MENAAIFRTLAENAPDIVCLHNPAGQYIYVSPSCKSILGYDPESLIGKTPFELIHPEDLGSLQQEVHPRVLKGENTTVIYRIRKSCGDYIWLETTGRPMVDTDGTVRQVVSISREIDTTGKTRNALLQGYAVSSAAVGIALADLDGTLFYVNPAFLQMWRITDAQEVVGRKILDFASNQEETARGLQVIKEKGNWTADIVARRTDGSSFDLHMVCNQVTDAGGQPCYLMAAFIDLTERKQLEKELKEHRDQLEMRVRERTAEITAMNERLKILSRRLIEIQEKERYNLARELHDQIGQSLNMIKILLDRVSSASDDDRRVFRSQALGMLTDLIDRVSDLTLELRPRMLDDLGLARALEWYFSNFTKRTNIRVRFTPSVIDEIPVSITNSIYRVVQEALTNVARHARAKSVTVRFKYARGRLQLNVEDDGIGFEPAAVNTAMLGGIINMRERIGLLGGTLELASEPGAGTRLYAEIPYQLQRHGKGGPKDGNHRHRR